MATTTEEVLMKMGFATDQFDMQVRSMKGKMGEAADAIEHHMQRPRAATMAFHHALTEITKISPILGELLQAAFNPVVAGIAAAGLVLKSFYEGLQEARKAAAEAAKAMKVLMDIVASPIGNAAESMVKARKDAADDRRKAAKEEAEANDPIAARLELLKEEQNILKSHKDAAGALAAQEKALAEIESLRLAKKASVDAYNQRALSGVPTGDELSRRAAEGDIKSVEEDLKKAKEVQKEMQEVYNEFQIEKEKAQEKPAPGSFGGQRLVFAAWGRIDEIEAYEKASHDVEMYTNALKKMKESEENADQRIKDAADVHAEEVRSLKQLEAAQKEYSKSIESTHAELQAQNIEEGKKALAAKTQSGINNIEKERTAGMLNEVQAAEKIHTLKVAHVKSERELEKAAAQERWYEANESGDEMAMGIAARAVSRLEDRPLDVVSDKEVQDAKRNMAKEQADFDRRRAKLEREEKRAEIEPYLPTIQELAKNKSWSGDTWRFGMPQGPMFQTSASMQAGEQARELQARERDMRAAVLAEGPQSSRAQQDLARIKELKGALESSGYSKVDHAEKISERMGELVEMAKNKGLKVQPSMGE